ncbi:MAG: DNA starvation/stationary phase protection protein [Rubrimonas sp.]|uniref:Dps family protein n=1 Tax=Rubrimonas sp. TaxID=2036015 RepID=UPI002FDE9F62
MSSIATSLAPDANAEIVDGLAQAVADLSVETLKAQNYHWNVTGMAFGPLHELFQKIYEDHFEGQDELAERIKMLGAHAEGTYSGFLKRARIRECDGRIDAQTMIANLKADQEALSGQLTALAELADKHGDLVTNDLAVERASVHDKFAWLLGAHLEG